MVSSVRESLLKHDRQARGGRQVKAAVPTAVLVLHVAASAPELEGHAVGAVAAMIRDDGLRIDDEFFAACPPPDGNDDRLDLPPSAYRFATPAAVRSAFWPFYRKYHERHYTLAAFSPFPVEVAFMAACLREHSEHPDDLPTPFIDLASVIWAQGDDPTRWPLADPERRAAVHPLVAAREVAQALYNAYGTNALMRLLQRDELVAASIILQQYSHKLPRPDPLVEQSRELLQMAMLKRRQNRTGTVQESTS